jgi:hypothetical protein
MLLNALTGKVMGDVHFAIATWCGVVNCESRKCRDDVLRPDLILWRLYRYPSLEWDKHGISRNVNADSVSRAMFIEKH